MEETLILGNMWKKGDLVWANLKYPDLWIPGRVQDPSESFGVLVSFFAMKEPRFFPAPFLRRFEHDFRTLIMGSLRIRRRIVNRALRAYFWSVSYGLWCPCQPPTTSPYLDRENSILWPSLSSDLALGFVREIAISHSVPLEALADANRSTAQILSFRRYTVDFKQFEALYEEIRASSIAERTGHSEESESCPDPSYGDLIAIDPIFPETTGSATGKSKDLSMKDPSPVEQLVEDDEARIHSWKTPARLAKQEVDHPSKSGEHGHDAVAPATTHETQTRNHDNAKPVAKMKREASLNAASAYSFKKQKIAAAAQQSASSDKPLSPHALKASRIADPRCLQMKFLGNHDDLPSEASLIKRFSVFGRIDVSETYVDKSKRSANVAFLRSIDAVMAYKYARSKKISFGQSKVVYRFDLFEQSSERDKDNAAKEDEAPEQVPTLKPCLKKPGSADEEARRKRRRRRNPKVKFQEEDN